MARPLHRRLWRIAGYLLLPLFCLTCLFTCSLLSPMGMAFWTTFEVANSTDEDLVITPIGARGAEGRRGTLPILDSRFYVRSTKQAEFPLPAGAALSLAYDWDDVQFTEIVCRRPDGSHLVLSTGLHPTRGQYQEPPTDRFEIDDLSLLEPASELHLAAIPSSEGRRPYLLFLLAMLGVLSPVCFWLARDRDFVKASPTPPKPPPVK